MCQGKVALVTGSSRGIGRCIALSLAREGAAVAVNYRSNDAAAKDLVDHILGGGGRAIAVQADVQQAGDCQRLVAAASEALGPIDICVVGPGGDWRMGKVHQVDPVGAAEDVQREVRPLFELMSLLMPGMYERKWGRLVGLSMLLDHAYNVHAIGYEVGKTARTAGLLFARDQAFKHNVTVNVVSPGPVSKPETLAEAIDLCNHGPAWKKRADLNAQDVAEGVVFLCSEAGTYVTGCQLPYVPHEF